MRCGVAGERTPHTSDQSLEALRTTLIDEWIGGQIRYHDRAARSHHLWARAGEIALWAIYVATVAVAVGHAVAHRHEPPLTLLSISLPALGGFVGALLTVRQHRALQKRSEQMRNELLLVRQDMCRAEARELPRRAVDAAQLIAQENGDWLGAMWFLEVEHV